MTVVSINSELEFKILPHPAFTVPELRNFFELPDGGEDSCTEFKEP